MKINKAGSSEIFDIYSGAMHQLKKQAAPPIVNIPVDLAGAGRRVIDEATEIAGAGVAAIKPVLKNSADARKFFQTPEGGGIDLIETVTKFNEYKKIVADSEYLKTLSPEAISDILTDLADMSAKLGAGLSKVDSANSSVKLITFLQDVRTDMGRVERALKAHQSRMRVAPTPPVPDEAVPAGRVTEEGVDVIEDTTRLSDEVPPSAPKGDIELEAAPDPKTLTEKVTKVTGSPASSVVTKTTEDISDSSKRLGVIEETAQEQKKAIGEIRSRLETLTDPSEIAAVKAQLSAMESGQASMIKTIETLKTEIGESIVKLSEATSAGVAKNQKAIEKLATEFAEESRKAGARAAKASDVPSSLREGARQGSAQWVQNFFREGAVAGILWTGLQLGVAFWLAKEAWYGWDRFWAYVSGDTERLETWQTDVTRLQQAIANSTAVHSALQFNPGSNGDTQNIDILDELGHNQNSAQLIYNLGTIDESTVFAVGEQLGELQDEVQEFLFEQNTIQQDLASQEKWEDAIRADQELLSVLSTMRVSLREIGEVGMRTGAGLGGSRVTPERETAPSASGPIGQTSEAPHILNVFGTEIDISDKPPGFRSAAPRMVKKLLSHPTGMAFLDPDNIWNGYLRKTGRPEVDYLNSLGYLYKAGVFTPSQLRKFIRHSLPKQGRRRHSGWKNAIKHYRRQGARRSRAENMAIYEDLIKRSTNRSTIHVRKMANQYPNKYISDAIVGLSDQYAKSYFAGLKSQYNSKPAKPKADYRDLYEVHNEKGADLIQEAHPEAVVVSDAMGNGGLVENLLEQKSQSEGVARSAPTGNFRGKHANLEVIEALTKIANQADEAGFFEVSELIDTTINNILDK